MYTYSANDSNSFWILQSYSYIFLKSLLQSEYYSDLITRYHIMGYKLPELSIDINSSNIEWVESNLFLSSGINSIALYMDNNKYHLDFSVDLYFCIQSSIDMVSYLDKLNENFYHILDLLEMEEDDFSYSVHLVSNKYNSSYNSSSKLNCDLLLLCNDIDKNLLSDFKGIYFTNSSLYTGEFYRLFNLGIIPIYEVTDYMNLYYELLETKNYREKYILRILCHDFDDLKSFASWLFKKKVDIELEIEIMGYDVIDNNAFLQTYLFYIKNIYEKYGKVLNFKYFTTLDSFEVNEYNEGVMNELIRLGLL